MSNTSFDNEVESLSTRAVSLVLIVMTVLFSVCWLFTESPHFQVATFLSGIVSIMTWLSYCQQKTSAEIEQLRANK